MPHISAPEYQTQNSPWLTDGELRNFNIGRKWLLNQIRAAQKAQRRTRTWQKRLELDREIKSLCESASVSNLIALGAKLTSNNNN